MGKEQEDIGVQTDDIAGKQGKPQDDNEILQKNGRGQQISCLCGRII